MSLLGKDAKNSSVWENETEGKAMNIAYAIITQTLGRF